MPATTLVSALMTSEVITLRPDQTVEAAADVLAEHHIGAAPVVADDGSLVGLLRDEDLIVSEARLHVPTVISFLNAEIVLPGSMHKFKDELSKAVGATVAEVMTTEIKTVKATDSLETLATLMHESDVTHVPVVGDDGKLVAIVSRGDLVRFLAATT